MNAQDLSQLKLLLDTPVKNHNLQTASFVIDLMCQYLKELAELLKGMNQ